MRVCVYPRSSDRSTTLHSNPRLPIPPKHPPRRQIRRLTLIIVDIIKGIPLLKGARAHDAAPVLLQTGLAGDAWKLRCNAGRHGDGPACLADPDLDVVCCFESCDVCDCGVEVGFGVVDWGFFPVGEDVGDEEVGGGGYL